MKTIYDSKRCIFNSKGTDIYVVHKPWDTSRESFDMTKQTNKQAKGATDKVDSAKSDAVSDILNRLIKTCPSVQYAQAIFKRGSNSTEVKFFEWSKKDLVIFKECWLVEIEVGIGS